jgi:hypothetical protein
MDIEQSLDNIKEAVEPMRYERSRDLFFKGYGSEFLIDDEFLSLRPVYRRFAELFSYT